MKKIVSAAFVMLLVSACAKPKKYAPTPLDFETAYKEIHHYSDPNVRKDIRSIRYYNVDLFDILFGTKGQVTFWMAADATNAPYVMVEFKDQATGVPAFYRMKDLKLSICPPPDAPPCDNLPSDDFPGVKP